MNTGHGSCIHKFVWITYPLYISITHKKAESVMTRLFCSDRDLGKIRGPIPLIGMRDFRKYLVDPSNPSYQITG